MKDKIQWFVSAFVALVLSGLCAFTQAHAQDEGPLGNRASHCTMGTASGTYGYRMSGQIVGVGVFLVNGIYTHNPDGTMEGDVQLTIGDQQIPATWTGGTWKINDDCTGSGKFFVPAVKLDVTYNFVASDGGNEIQLLNTNPGIVLTGVSRRISPAGKAPSCNNGTVLGTYSYYGGGSIPGVPLAAGVGTFTHTVDDNYKGNWTGTDTFNFMGQYAPRLNKGIYTLNNNCRGIGFYTDSLGNKVNYTFTVVDGGDTLFLSGTDPGVAVQLVGKRLK